MKNKKLFAILTLVCFMFTLMPVAAFAADATYVEVAEDYDYVKTGEDIKLQSTTTGTFIVFAINSNDVVNKGLGFKTLTADADGVITVEDGLANAGTYKFHVVENNNYNKGVVARYNDAEITRAEAAELLIKETNIVMLDNTVVVKAVAKTYEIEAVKNITVDTDEDGVESYSVVVGADSGYSEKEVTVKLVDASNTPVVGATLTVSTNTSAVAVDKTEVTTNAAGLAKFKITGSIAGDFKVYVEYGTKAEMVIDVTSTPLTPANIVTIAQPKTPMALNTPVNKTGIYFNITDANGNNTGITNVIDEETNEVVKPANYKVTVVEKPAGSDVVASELYLQSVAGKGWALFGAGLDEEGTYTFKVTLNNGAYAVASAEAKEFQTPVSLVLTYPAPAVELGGEIAVEDLLFIDANGVASNAAGKVTLSANGYAVDKFEDVKVVGEEKVYGVVTAESDEKYVGSKITVLAVSEKYNLTAVAELVVANEAAAVKYANTNADIAVNNTLVANIVDADGNKVSVDTTDKYAIQYIVVEKPANSKVAVSTHTDLDPVTGQFKVSFTASAIGEYKLQTIVRSTDENNVVKYYSGIETITVGNTGVEDVVVMSVNSNEIVKNGKVAVIDAAPIVENNRTFVPFRALAEAFGATVAYDEATQAVTAELNGVTVVMTIGSAEYTVNGEAKTADVAPFINGSRTMVPVRFAAEAFGIKVIPTYDENGATADILFNL